MENIILRLGYTDDKSRALIRKLLARLESLDCNEEEMCNLIATTAVEQWTKLQTRVDDYGDENKATIISALKDGGIKKQKGEHCTAIENELSVSGVLIKLTVSDDALYTRILYASSTIIRSLDPRQYDIKMFVLAVLNSFNPMYLRNGYSIGQDGCLLEGAWQKEFYRAATTILPSGMYISPEAGAKFSTAEVTVNGRVDFYVHDAFKKQTRWCIELLRESTPQSIEEHVKRFEGRGEYSKIPHTKYIIIDFRLKNFTSRQANAIVRDGKRYAKVWFATYTEDVYTPITVSEIQGKRKKKIVKIKTINLSDEGFSTFEGKAFEALQEKIIQKCKDDTIKRLSATIKNEVVPTQPN